ncbi:MAG: nuclear transport factor 2 family protein [Acidimicrobiia bacterium]|jgi:hypothetical protein
MQEERITPESVEEWAGTYRNTWETADSQAAAELFTPDGTYRDDIYQDPNRGREGVVTYWEKGTSAQSNAAVRMGKLSVDDDRAVVEFWTTMRPDDEPVTATGPPLLRFSGGDGLCRSLREYWNSGEGHVDPAGEWGT